MKQLTLLWGGRKQAVFLLDEPHVVIGRGRSAHVALDGNPIVSRQHAVIRAELDAHVLEDLGGANGTFVNDQRIGQVRLRLGDRIIIGKHTLRYEESTPEAVSLKRKAVDVDPAEDESPATVQNMPAMTPGKRGGPPPAPWQMTAEAEGGIGGSLTGGNQERTVAASKDELETLLAQMKVKSGPHVSIMRKGKIDLVPLDEPPILIGHTDECRIRLKGSKWFGRIAAAMDKDGGTWWIHARSPFWNPVQVGGSKLAKKRKLTNGATIVAGDLKFRFSIGEQ
ncbi:MAG: FHA domain-containing protein [Proteobacteria bacterium]|nr:FHA domain-containing protein [Pseudomonadota bacterium]